jgi:DNA invertase Pin-like site-specific DNA recombinase
MQDGQSVDAQMKQLREAGAEKVFRETASGAKSDRAGLRRAIDHLGKGDVLMVTRLDRLARSTRDLFNTVEAIIGRGAGFKSIADTWADSTTAHGRLMLAVLSGLAEFESALIHARTGEGRKRAKERGVKMGRKPKLTPHQQREAIKRLEGERGEIARTYNVSHGRFRGWAKAGAGGIPCLRDLLSAFRRPFRRLRPLSRRRRGQSPFPMLCSMSFTLSRSAKKCVSFTQQAADRSTHGCASTTRRARIRAAGTSAERR